MLWLNYPNNPTGARAPVEFYEDAAALAREHGFVLASDEAYSELYFAGEPPASRAAGRRPLARRGLQHAVQALVDARLPLRVRRRRPGDRRGAEEVPAQRRRGAAGDGPARGDRGLGRRDPRRRGARALPRQARRPPPRAGGARAARRGRRRDRSSCGWTPARTPTRSPRAGSRRASSSRRARSSARPGTCGSRSSRRPRPARAPPRSSGPLRDLHANRVRAESFGTLAEEYDRLRPTIPPAVVDALVALAPERVLDVGCGTGKVARALLERGLSVLGVEFDERMAAVARGHGVEVEVGAFEDWDARGRTFDLIVASDCWHWIDPERGWRKVGEVLAPGGTMVQDLEPALDRAAAACDLRRDLFARRARDRARRAR